MDISVISEGVELNVSGVTEETTCLQIVYALAHATNQKGKFVLVAHLNGNEHRLSQNEKPLDIMKKYNDTPVIFELRHLDQHDIITGTPSSSVNSFQNYNLNDQKSESYSALPSQQLQKSGRQISLPSNGFSHIKQKGPRLPPPTYDEVIEQRYSSLSRGYSRASHNSFYDYPKTIEVPGFTIDDFSLYSRTDLERILQQQLQYITHQKSQLIDLDIRLSNSSEREILQLKKQHNNLITVLNSLRNVNWPLRLQQAQDEAERLDLAIDEMKSIVDNRKCELLAWVQYQQSLEGQLDVSFSEAETLSPQDDSSQYWSTNDFVLS